MRVLAKVQLLYTLNAQAQQLEMFWDLKISRQLLNKAVAGLPWTSRSWPSPERSTSRTELLPMPLTLSNRLPAAGRQQPRSRNCCLALGISQHSSTAGCRCNSSVLALRASVSRSN